MGLGWPPWGLSSHHWCCRCPKPFRRLVPRLCVSWYNCWWWWKNHHPLVDEWIGWWVYSHFIYLYIYSTRAVVTSYCSITQSLSCIACWMIGRISCLFLERPVQLKKFGWFWVEVVTFSYDITCFYPTPLQYSLDPIMGMKNEMKVTRV